MSVRSMVQAAVAGPALVLAACVAMDETDRGADAEAAKVAAVEARVAEVVDQMTLEEKVSLLAGANSMTLNGVARLGLPSIGMTDGPTGVRSPDGRPATVFPVGVAVASTWNTELAAEVGAAIADEARAYGASVLLAPTVNIVRTPRWGRNFETYSEDPYLSGEIGLGYTRGAQSRGIGVSVKHYAANNQETNRFTVDSIVDERVMREIYLPAFERVVKDGKPWSVMASYNKLNGTYAAESPWLLTDVLRTDWGYDGVVVSDWGATHSTAPAVKAGLDLEMPGPPVHFGDKLLAAAKGDAQTQAAIDTAAGRMVRMIVRADMADAPTGSGAVGGAEHQEIARRAAEEAIVLMRNTGVLPLDPGIRTLAVIGPNADVVRIQGGGSSAVQPFEALKTPLAALREALPGVNIVFERGVDNEETPPPARPEDFSPTRERTETGLTATYYASKDWSGPPTKTERVTEYQKRIAGNVAGLQATGYASMRWEGFFWPQTTGRHEFSVRGTGSAIVYLDAKQVLDRATPSMQDNRDVIGFAVPRRTAGVDLEAGKPYAVRIDYVTGNTPYEALSFGVRMPQPNFNAAIAAARGADAAIVIVGSGAATEGEGYDRGHINLPGEQDRLVASVAAANPKTVVVVNSGGPMTMPWKDTTPAILQMWLPGQAGPDALADIIFGRVNPSGKLPVTFPARSEDDAIDLASKASAYAEGLLVGYRGYDARGVEPLFPFGHGLSYTTFDYNGLKASVDRGSTHVEVEVRNIGARAGKEVVQVYVAPLNRPENEAPRQLRAFTKVDLGVGEAEWVSLNLPPRAFAVYDVAAGGWIVRPGAYKIEVGSSSRDIRQSAVIQLEGGRIE